MLRSLHIRGFRSLYDIELVPIGAVNLIIGRGNSGKTSLLEAVFLFCSSGDAFIPFKGLGLRRLNLEKLLPDETVRQLGWCYSSGNSPLIINVDGMWNEMKRSVEFRRSSGDNLGQIQWQVSGEPIQGQVRPVETTLAVFDVATVDSNGAQAKVKGELRITSQGYEVKPSPNANISARYLTPSESFAPLPALWSEVDDRGERSSVLELLKLIDPQIKDVRIRVDAVNRSSIRLEHVTRGVVPVEGEGAGISKILLLASAALASHDGVFLIDEFDASLHVAVQPQVADFLLRAASRLRVQLFITTHSLETLDIFLDAFEATRDLFTNSTELRVLQLRKEGDQTKVENLPSDRARSMREELGLDLRRTS